MLRIRVLYVTSLVLMTSYASCEIIRDDVIDESISSESSCEASGPWSSLLVEWATGYTDHRQQRIMKLTPSQDYYVVNRVDTGVPNTYNEWTPATNTRQSPPPITKPGKIVNRPPQLPGTAQQMYDNQKQQMQQKPEQPKRKEVSETDLYLLSAIEKLVYRVDFMEKRIRKLEENMYYMISGVNKSPEPCPHNYTRVGTNCYYIGYFDKYDWKTASYVCKKLKGHLVEMETLAENKNLIAYLQTEDKLKGKDYWTGGLNPGLLWIWSGSARPVKTNDNETQSLPTSTTNVNQSITGNGRCLKLTYNPSIRSYYYFGFDCAARFNYICEMPEKELSNKIEKAARHIEISKE